MSTMPFHLDDLGDVGDLSGRADGDFIQYTGTEWASCSNLDLHGNTLHNVSNITIEPSSPAGLPTLGNDDILIVKRNGDAAVQIITGTGDVGAYWFSDSGADRGGMKYDHATDQCELYAAGTRGFYVSSSGRPHGNVRVNSGGVTLKVSGTTGEFWAQSSSRRFKEDERPLDFDPVAAILDFPTPMLFKFKDDVFTDPSTQEQRVAVGGQSWGWMAEDVLLTDAARFVEIDLQQQAVSIVDGNPFDACVVEVLKSFDARLALIEARLGM